MGNFGKIFVILLGVAVLLGVMMLITNTPEQTIYLTEHKQARWMVGTVEDIKSNSNAVWLVHSVEPLTYRHGDETVPVAKMKVLTIKRGPDSDYLRTALAASDVSVGDRVTCPWFDYKNSPVSLDDPTQGIYLCSAEEDR